MNVVVAQSGGPTAVINASLLGVYRQSLLWDEVETVYGSLNGIEGILKDHLVSLNDLLADEETCKTLRQTPASALGSCRYKMPLYDEKPEVYEQIRLTLEKYDIGAFFYIGGNDSMDTVDKLSAYFTQIGSPIQVIGVPKTIDNDLMGTDHTPGYGSAAKFVATAMSEMIRDYAVYDMNNVLIVEIMGRDTGWLTAAAALPRLNGEIGPHLIYLPEAEFSAERFVEDVRREVALHRAVVVAVSEGIQVDIVEGYRFDNVDTFGHQYLSGVGRCLENLVRCKLGYKVRTVELSILQRCSAHVASLTDIREAEQVGEQAVLAAAAGITGQMITICRDNNAPYAVHFGHTPVSGVANQIKYVPQEWIAPDGNDVTPEALEYIKPLVMGELPQKTENGMPAHCRFL